MADQRSRENKELSYKDGIETAAKTIAQNRNSRAYERKQFAATVTSATDEMVNYVLGYVTKTDKN